MVSFSVSRDGGPPVGLWSLCPKLFPLLHAGRLRRITPHSWPAQRHSGANHPAHVHVCWNHSSRLQKAKSVQPSAALHLESNREWLVVLPSQMGRWSFVFAQCSKIP